MNSDEKAGGSAKAETPPSPTNAVELALPPFGVRNTDQPWLKTLRVIRDGREHGYLHLAGQTTVYRLDSARARALMIRQAADSGALIHREDLTRIVEELRLYAVVAPRHDVWVRVAPVPGGVEIDLGDDVGTRVRVTAGTVETLSVGTPTLFYRPPTMRPLPMPADHGDLRLLDRYINLSAPDLLLLKAWLSYTLAHAKVGTTSFPCLVFAGGQGSGKSALCKMVQRLIHPDHVGLQTFPRDPRDLAIAAQQSHLLLFDNVRDIRPYMADALCMACTGGQLSTRQLYSDTDQVSLSLHVPIILNGIHSFIDQPDLAQRCLPLTLLALDDQRRRSEAALMAEFESDLPCIFKGLLGLIAGVFTQYPNVTPKSPERLIEFSHWLAAMEAVDGVPPTVYQTHYSATLSEGMVDSLLENPLAAAIVDLLDGKPSWTGTPTELYETLCGRVTRRTEYSPEWPRNPISLSKQLKALEVGLHRVGIRVRLSRSRERTVTLTRAGSGTY